MLGLRPAGFGADIACASAVVRICGVTGVIFAIAGIAVRVCADIVICFCVVIGFVVIVVIDNVAIAIVI